MKSLQRISVLVLLLLCCSACTTNKPADGFEELQGNWVIKGYEYNNNLYSAALDPQVKKMLSFDDIEFFADGTYEYFSLYENHGKYRRLTKGSIGNENPDSTDFLLENNYTVGVDLDDKTGEKRTKSSQCYYVKTGELHGDKVLFFTLIENKTKGEKNITVSDLSYADPAITYIFVLEK